MKKILFTILLFFLIPAVGQELAPKERELILEAQSLIKENKSQKAIRTLELIIEKYHNLQCFLLLGELYLEKRLFDKGVSVVEKGLKYHPDFGYLWALKGDLLYLMKDFQNAEKAYLKALDNKVRNPHYFLALGDIYRRTGNNNSALKYANDGLIYHPDYYKLQNLLGLIHLNNNDTDKAMTSLLGSLKLNGTDPETLTYVGDLMVKLKRDDDAFYYYDLALKNGSELESAYYEAGKIRCRKGNFDDGINILKKGITKFSKNRELLNSLAECYKGKGDFKNAVYYEMQAK